MNTFVKYVRTFKTNTRFCSGRRLIQQKNNAAFVNNKSNGLNVEATVSKMIDENNKRKENNILIGVATFCFVSIVLMI